jgi:hypothetical protein
MTVGGISLGYLQGVSIDFNFDRAMLYSGANIYPVDVRTHTGTITGNAEFADLTAVAFEKLLGGTRNNDQIDLDNSDYPTTFQMVTTLVTDSITFEVTFNAVRSTKLSLAFARDQHLIPNFDFECYADTNGDVATIDVGDVS